MTQAPPASRAAWRSIVFPILAGLFALGGWLLLEGLTEGLMPWVIIGCPGCSPDFKPESRRWFGAEHGAIIGILFSGSLVALLRRPRMKPLLLQFYVVGHVIFLLGLAAWQWQPAALPLKPTVVVMFLIVLGLLAFSYPDPRSLLDFSRPQPGGWVPGWTRWVAIGWGAFLLPTALVPGSIVDSSTWPGALLVTALLGVTASAIYAQQWRYRHSLHWIQRQQSKLAIFGISTALASWVGLVFVLYVFLPQADQTGSAELVLFGAAFRIVQLAIPVSIAIAVTRYRLWDIDPLVRRTLVYGGLTAAVVGLYVLVVGYFAVFFQVRDSPLPSLLATGAVAVLVQPLREFLQRGVSRLLYGKRAEPYTVLSGLAAVHRVAADALLVDTRRSIGHHTG